MSDAFCLKLTNAEYHLRPELSCTGLKELNRSPAHYKNYVCGDRKTTPAMLIGSYFHAVILEPEIAASDYAIAPAGMSFAKKTGIQWKLENASKQVIKFEDWQMIDSMKNQVTNSALCMGLLSFGGEAEVSIFWTDDETGAKCKCRPDYLNHGLQMAIDIKTTEDASPEAFLRQSFNMSYHLQAPFYQRGILEMYNAYYEWLFLVIEKGNPYLEPVIKKPSAHLLELGDNKISELLKLYASCEKSGKWFGYEQGIEEYDAPAWVKEENL